MTHFFLIDTCVWLELAKDHRNQGLLSALEDLCTSKDVVLLVPTIIVDEFNRNKDRVAKSAKQSISHLIKDVKRAVEQYGDADQIDSTLQHLSDINHKMPLLGESAFSGISRVEKLLSAGKVIPISNEILALAAQRAMHKRAPFHRSKNSIADAILIEVYAAELSNAVKNCRYRFVTLNTDDFSHPGAHTNLPHPDLSPLFSKIKSVYSTNLATALHKVKPEVVSESLFYQDLLDDPRGLTEILAETESLAEKIWYNRHKILEEKIADGRITLIARSTPTTDHQNTILQSIWKGAQKGARRLERKYGASNLIWDDFHWGMLNGKLSALRWVMGEDWDELYT